MCYRLLGYVKLMAIVIPLLTILQLTALVHFAAGLVLYDFAPIIHSWDMQLGTFSKYLLVGHLRTAHDERHAD